MIRKKKRKINEQTQQRDRNGIDGQYFKVQTMITFVFLIFS
eukprot:UN03056